MRPLIKFFGSKYRLAKHYGAPSRKVLVETFAGAAGYALYYDWPDTILIEKYDVMAGIWHWLIHTATPADIRAVPDDAHNRDMVPGPEPLRDIVCYWFGRGDAKPRQRMTDVNIHNRDTGTGGGNYWGANVKERLIDALPLIRKWRIIHGDYTQAPDGDDIFTFVDPPYQHEGTLYPHSCKQLDYGALGRWCQRRQCAVVCESSQADWLPFEPLVDTVAQSGNRYSEVVWRTEEPASSLLTEDTE